MALILADGTYNAFPGLVRLPDGRRILVYRKAASHVGGKGDIVMRSAASQGAAYGAESVVYSATGPNDSRDPEIANIATPAGMQLMVGFFEYNGVLLNAIRITTSSDGGVTWSPPTTATDGFAAWVACSAKIIQLPNGSLVLPVYGSDDGPTELIEVLRSDDFGATWTAVRPWVTPYGSAMTEPNIVLMDDGNLLMLIRTYDGGTHESVSTDGGLTWSTPVSISPHGGRPHCLPLPDGSVGVMQRRTIDARAVYAFRDGAGVWSTHDYADATLLLRMTYASSLIDEDGNWELVICEEQSGTASDILGITLPLIASPWVVSQDVLPGTSVTAGSTVSLGFFSPPVPAPIVVQDYFGDSAIRAAMRLLGAGLVVG